MDARQPDVSPLSIPTARPSFSAQIIWTGWSLVKWEMMEWSLVLRF